MAASVLRAVVFKNVSNRSWVVTGAAREAGWMGSDSMEDRQLRVHTYLDSGTLWELETAGSGNPGRCRSQVFGGIFHVLLVMD